MVKLKVKSAAREQLVDITREVARAVSQSDLPEGICSLFVAHTTAGITINENADPDVKHDLLLALRKLIPQHGMGFLHQEDNSDAHLKTSLVGSSVSIPFSAGHLLLGRWQGIFLAEFDGPREREVILMLR